MGLKLETRTTRKIAVQYNLATTTGGITLNFGVQVLTTEFSPYVQKKPESSSALAWTRERIYGVQLNRKRTWVYLARTHDRLWQTLRLRTAEYSTVTMSRQGRYYGPMKPRPLQRIIWGNNWWHELYSFPMEKSMSAPHEHSGNATASRCTIRLPQRHNRRGNMESRWFLPFNRLGRGSDDRRQHNSDIRHIRQ